jgi:hypothetical protein
MVRGTVLTAAGQPEAAIPELQRSRSIYESLYKGGVVDQANVAATDVKLGEAAFRAGHDEAAASYFQEALNIAEPLIVNKNILAMYVAADAHSGLGDLGARKARQRGASGQVRTAQWTEARSQYQKSLDAWHLIEHPNHTGPHGFQVGDPVLVAKQLKTADEALLATH